MANSTDLRKTASAIFTPFMTSKGFTHGDGCFYYRTVGDGVIQSVIVVPVKGTHGRIWVTCTVAELLQGGYVSGEKIKSKNVGIDSGGMLCVDGIEDGPDLFPQIDSPERREAFFRELPKWIDMWALPFFDRINTRSALWMEMEIHGGNDFYRKAVLGQ